MSIASAGSPRFKAMWVVIAITSVVVAQAMPEAQLPMDHPIAVVPDAPAFLAAAQANLLRAQQAAHQFSYQERRTRFRTNPLGKLGPDGTELYQVYPSANPQLTYRRLLERDGIPVSDLAKRDREHQARTAEVLRRRDKQSDDDRRQKAEDEGLARRRAQAMIDDIVAALQFTVSGRTIYDGDPAITVAFVGNRAFRPATREGRIAQKLEGTVWIHSGLNEVMHVEAKAIDEISFGFGIVARINKGTAGWLTRRPIGTGLKPDLWMPTNLRLSGSGRAMLFLRTLRIEYVADWFDYRRLTADTPWGHLNAKCVALSAAGRADTRRDDQVAAGARSGAK